MKKDKLELKWRAKQCYLKQRLDNSNAFLTILLLTCETFFHLHVHIDLLKRKSNETCRICNNKQFLLHLYCFKKKPFML